MPCLSIFQATLSIRESVALAVNLQAASRLPAPPRRAAVCMAAHSISAPGRQGCSAGVRQALLGWAVLGGPASPALQDAAELWPEEEQSQQPPVPMCGSNGDGPCPSRLPCSPGCGRCGLHKKGTQKSPPTLGQRPSLEPQHGTLADPRDRGWMETPSHMGEPRDWPRSCTGGGGRAGRRMGHGDKPCSGFARSLAAAWLLHPQGSGAPGARWTFPAGSKLPAASGTRRRHGGSAAGQCCWSGTKSPVLLGHRSAEESEGTACAEPDTGARE